VLAVGGAASAVALGLAVARLRSQDVPRTAVLGAVFFVASLIAIPVGPTAVHPLLGGLMGIVLAGVPNSPIRRLVINDIAPEVPMTALQRLAIYLGADRRFPDVAAVEAHLRETLAPFGPMTEADWRRMAETSAVATEGGYRLAYDPGIAHNFRRFWLPIHANLWRYWERISCPVLILRGTESDFLSPLLLERMVRRLPHAEVVEFEGVGHTPTLNAATQIEPLLHWLRSAETTVG
jgi:pimeloyl-ACP methyl ester carboxylesterase